MATSWVELLAQRIPIHPTAEELAEKLAVRIPNEHTERYAAKAKELGYRNVWVQPGAESPAVVAYLQEEGFNYLANACIMV